MTTHAGDWYDELTERVLSGDKLGALQLLDRVGCAVEGHERSYWLTDLIVDGEHSTRTGAPSDRSVGVALLQCREADRASATRVDVRRHRRPDLER